MIACLAILKYSYLQPFFCISDSFCLASLSRSRLLFTLIPFLLWCVYAILLFVVLVGATTTHVKCAIRHAVKVIRRLAHEHAIEKTIHTYVLLNIYIADFH